MKYELTGYNIDNLLNTLYIKKVTLFNVVKTSSTEVSFEIMDKDSKKVKRYIANYKVKQTLTGIRKLPKFLLANLGLILGVFFGFIFMLFVSNYTWQIKVFGTEELSANDIINVLHSNNIKKGKINFQTSEEIEDILMNNYNRIAQVSVIRVGTAIIINLSEKLIYEEEKFEAITAKYNGIVKEINVVTGTVNVKIGEYVNVGDVLVLPFNINSNGEKVSVKPLAEIAGEVFIVNKQELRKTEKILVRTGNKNIVYKYKFNNLNLFSSKIKNSFAIFDLVVYNENISSILPLNRDVYAYYELKTSVIEHNFETEKANLIEKSQDNAKKNLPAGEILSQNTNTTIIGDTMIACTTIKMKGLIS